MRRIGNDNRSEIYGTAPRNDVSRTVAPGALFWNGRNGTVHIDHTNGSGTVRTVLSCQCERGICQRVTASVAGGLLSRLHRSEVRQ